MFRLWGEARVLRRARRLVVIARLLLVRKGGMNGSETAAAAEALIERGCRSLERR